MRIAFVGQPNSGKSTLFNSVAGYKSLSANFPGSTVHYTFGKARVSGEIIEVVDLPGTYSLTASSPAEAAAKQYLLEEEIDAVINVVDASLLSRSLELTLELIELQIPLVVCLNMIDEAERKGIHIDAAKLSELLGVPVATTVATKGIGVDQLFYVARRVARKQELPSGEILGHKDIEDVFAELAEHINGKIASRFPISKRLLAIKLLEGDEAFLEMADEEEKRLVAHYQDQLEKTHGRPADMVIASERHALAMELAEAVSTVTKPRRDIRDTIDDLLMHRIWGYAFLFLIIYIFFALVFRIGALFEGPLLKLFDSAIATLGAHMDRGTLLFALLKGVVQGVAGGVAIVLPYLVPFLIGLAVLEDVGYLPRVAFLMDAFMHRIGLHGTAIVPAILGYGCNVPAVMATRVLTSPRDRTIAAVISTLVPCSARMTVIFGLVAFYLGPSWALALYVFDIAVIAASGKVISLLMPELTPGMILEVPRYQLPALRSLLSKTWLRMREFVVVAWPLLIIGSALLALGEFYHVDKIANVALSPLTTLVLGLPVAVGTTLIFGVLRKELSMIMLIQALGTANILSVMTPQQVMVFTVFVMFYIPCVATIGVLVKEIGTRFTLYTIAYTFLLATAIAALVRIAFTIFNVF
ncbi:MAG: ferrous iron transport protein B [Bacteroidota bacterium]